MSKTCVKCGAVSQTGVGYATRRDKSYCPICNAKRLTEGGGSTLLLLAGCMILAWLITRGHSPRATQLAWISLNLYLFFIVDFVIALPHELGHALSARLMGCRIFRVSVGIGPVLWKGSFLGGTLEIHRYPFGGHTIALDSREKGFRLRYWISVACGPLVNLLLLAAILPFLPRPFLFSSLAEGWNPKAVFLFANVYVLINNLIPRKTQGTIGPIMSDGLQLLRTPFLSREEIRKGLSLSYGAPASVELAAGRNEEACRLYREGLKAFPESLYLRHDLSLALLRLGNLEESRREFQALSNAPEGEPQFRLMCLNNLAAANLLIGRPELLDEADRTSAEAMTSLAWHPSIQGTRAAVLVEMGKLDEGIAMARASLERADEAKAKGWSACTLAIALKRKGDDVEGRKYFELAAQSGIADSRMQRVRELYGASSAESRV